jgi:hypothetical protein
MSIESGSTLTGSVFQDIMTTIEPVVPKWGFYREEVK